jgi:hypothetical protein
MLRLSEYLKHGDLAWCSIKILMRDGISGNHVDPVPTGLWDKIIPGS